MSKDIVPRIFRVLVYMLLPTGILLAGFLYVNPSGIRTVTYTVGEPSPMLSALFPAHRLAKIAEGAQLILTEPVYGTVRYPRPYQYVRIKLTMDNPENIPFRVGVLLRDGSYALKSPDDAGTYSFDTSQIAVLDRKLRYIISAPGLKPDDGVYIRRIEVTLFGEPMQALLLRKLTSNTL